MCQKCTKMSLQITNFTEPKVVTNDNLQHRSYVTFYFNDEIQKEYNGKNVGLKINPNRARSLVEKSQLLKKLQFEIYKSWEGGNYPIKATSSLFEIPNKPNFPVGAMRLLFEAIRDKLRADLSRTYKRNFKSVYREFRSFILSGESDGPINEITTIRIEKFLSQFGSLMPSS